MPEVGAGSVPASAASRARDAAFTSGCCFLRISVNFPAAAKRHGASALGLSGAGEGGRRRRGRERSLAAAGPHSPPGRVSRDRPHRGSNAAGRTGRSPPPPPLDEFYLQLWLSSWGAWRGERRKEEGCKTGFLLERLFVLLLLFLLFSFLLADKTGQGVFVGEREGGKVFQK